MLLHNTDIMKKILFPIDFSKASLNAFSYALHMAKKLQAEIVTLHMYELPGQDYDALYPFLNVNYEINDLSEFENYKSSVRSLNMIAEKHNLGGVKLSHVLREGSVSEGILEAARVEMPDYIVLGTHGATGLSGALFGSVAERIINGAEVPVLAIPQGCSFNAIDKILFLTKYSEAEVKIMDEVIAVASRLKAHTDVLEVRKHHKNNETKMLKTWQEQYAAANVKFYVEISDDIEESVLKFVTQNKIDLVVMTVEHKGILEKLFFYSLSKNMAYHSVVPILSIPIGMSAAKTKLAQEKKMRSM